MWWRRRSLWATSSHLSFSGVWPRYWFLCVVRLYRYCLIAEQDFLISAVLKSYLLKITQEATTQHKRGEQSANNRSSMYSWCWPLLCWPLLRIWFQEETKPHTGLTLSTILHNEVQNHSELNTCSISDPIYGHMECIEVPVQSSCLNKWLRRAF